VQDTDQAGTFALLAIVGRLHPVTLWIMPHDWPVAGMRAMTELHSASALLPLYLTAWNQIVW